MRFHVWDEEKTERYILSRVVALLEKREGQNLREVVLRLPMEVVKFAPPKTIKRWAGPYHIQMTLRWYGMSSSAGWILKYRVDKVYLKNAFSQAFLDPNKGDKGEQ